MSLPFSIEPGDSVLFRQVGFHKQGIRILKLLTCLIPNKTTHIVQKHLIQIIQMLLDTVIPF